MLGSSLVLGLGLELGIRGKGKGRGWGYSAWFMVGSESVILTLIPMHTETYGTPHTHRGHVLGFDTISAGLCFPLGVRVRGTQLVMCVCLRSRVCL